MKKFTRDKDALGQYVIYVSECDNFEYEYQADVPSLNKEYIEVYIRRKIAEKLKKYSIIYLVENYKIVWDIGTRKDRWRD